MNTNLFQSQSITTTASIVSSVTGCVRGWLIEQFPANYFKSVYISTGIPSIDNRETNKENVNAYRKNNPVLAIKPTLNLDGMVGDTLSRMDTFYSVQDDSHLVSFLNAEDEFQTVKFQYNRYKINFSIGIRVESELQMLDIMGYVKSKMKPQNYFFINNTPMHVELPNSIVSVLAADMNLDINKKEDIATLINHLQLNSRLPVDVKIKTESGRKVISIIITVNLLCRIEDLPDGAMNRINRASDHSQVIFGMTAELSYPSKFFARTTVPPVEDTIDTSEFFINYTIPSNPPHSYPANPTFKMKFKHGFITDINVATDNLEVSDVLPDIVNRYIDAAYENGTESELSTTLLFKLFIDGSLVDESKYSFDYALRKLIINSPYFNYIYHIVLYAESQIFLPLLSEDMSITDIESEFDNYILN